MGRPGQPSFMWRAASSLAGGLLTIVTLGYANRGSGSATTQTEQETNKSNATQTSDLATSEPLVRPGQGCYVLAEQSALLLLVLTTQAGSISKCTTLPQELGLESETPTLNPYRMALFSLKDDKVQASQQSGSTPEPNTRGVPKSQPGGAMLRGIVSTENPEVDAFPVDFTAFRDTAARTMHQDSSALLLYLLVHRNTHFQAFLLQNQNYEKLLLPLLNVLYRSPADSSHLVYMALIIILILTENEKFGQEIHNSLINWVDWSPSRRLTSISRGSLIILVLIRTIRYHLNQLKDKYLHVNILAALANLSAKVKNLHPHVSDSFLW
ncbi:unnamed protein product [Echinostoma caproni]|uniref:Dymeclin n=1 Tax=Echinostoma caproni TaxID=27848 RepID=A0A183AWP1_9TREM|nr:unnamed protein product [Echinostoma caproni]